MPNAADDFIARWQTVPRWVLITAIVVVVGAGYWIYQSINSNSSSNQQKKTQQQQWNQRAVDYLVNQGYTPDDASSAIDAYQSGSALSPIQSSLVSDAVVNTQATSTGQTGSEVAFWNVPVGSAGWSTTFSGIGGQFGVSPTTLEQLNPNLSSTTWGKLPQGSTVKVPRNPGND